MFYFTITSLDIRPNLETLSHIALRLPYDTNKANENPIHIFRDLSTHTLGLSTKMLEILPLYVMPIVQNPWILVKWAVVLVRGLADGLVQTLGDFAHNYDYDIIAR